MPSGRVVDYFIADQVYVKWGKDVYGKDIVDDFIVIENKLQQKTKPTTPQNKGRGQNHGNKEY
ncbi:MAG: hypothetical protein IPH57_08685 [Saprospiraceae bacterium]|nr:hypothetical protein [Saprospiraceae bacterium]